MDAQEFRKDFLENVKAEAAATTISFHSETLKSQFRI